MMRKPMEKNMAYDWDGTRSRQNRSLKIAAVSALPLVLIGIFSLSLGF